MVRQLFTSKNLAEPPLRWVSIEEVSTVQYGQQTVDFTVFALAEGDAFVVRLRLLRGWHCEPLSLGASKAFKASSL